MGAWTDTLGFPYSSWSKHVRCHFLHRQQKWSRAIPIGKSMQIESTYTSCASSLYTRTHVLKPPPHKRLASQLTFTNPYRACRRQIASRSMRHGNQHTIQVLIPVKSPQPYTRGISSHTISRTGEIHNFCMHPCTIRTIQLEKAQYKQRWTQLRGTAHKVWNTTRKSYIPECQM